MPRKVHTVRAFSDRVLRDQLRNPDNVRDFVREALPHLVDRLDFSKMVIHDREFALPEFRVRESDLLLRIPYRDDPNKREILLVILIEHQTTVDPIMPLRLLIYIALYWIWQLRQPRKRKRGEGRWLTPIISAVLYTGKRPWRKNRNLDDLIDGPPEVRALCPKLEPTFWVLPEHASEKLWASKGVWIRTLPVIREDDAPANRFQEVLAETARRLKETSETDPSRWTHLLQFIWNWSANRRDHAEVDAISGIIQQIYQDGKLSDEVQAMSKTIGEAWMEQGLRRGLERGREEGQLRTLRGILTNRITQRFGHISQAMARRIASTRNAQALEQAIYALDSAKSARDIKV